eukprot:TRINITY_DN784_c0_g1_i3.p2 TRINITY_DN784_c0_g1~~TRINITY_DN784_c0_g1_i3.p2  ORF type:complete len:123 (-),score=44.48 TRINITY_DN784_c0_g1_i3:25-393(-)
MVPIVMGAPNIDDYAPTPHSIIKATDFASPKELANYINMLDQNDALYDQYLDYKNPRPGQLEAGYRQQQLSPHFRSLFGVQRGECALVRRILELRGGEGKRASLDGTCLKQGFTKQLENNTV